MDSLTVKVFLEKEDGYVETRRVPLSQENLSQSSRLYETINSKVTSAFSDLHDRIFSLMWKDSDGDYVLMSSDVELQDALKYVTNKILKLYIQVIGVKPKDAAMEVPRDQDQSEGNEPKGKKGDHEKPDPFEASWYSQQPDGTPMCHPPPPFPFPPHPFGFGPMKRGCRGKHMGHHGGPFEGHHRGLRHFKGHHGGPFGGHHGFPFGGPHEGSHRGPFGPHYGGPFRHFHGAFDPFVFHHGYGMGGHGCGRGGRCGKQAWKAALREAVPKLHRQWAKSYIQEWRIRTLKNATTTTSESDANSGTEKMTMEQAGVPEAYAQWLDFKLPRWHKKWGQDEFEGESDEQTEKGEEVKRRKKVLQLSVPKEFRKWVKWYLNKNFGKREAPVFYVNQGKCGFSAEHKWSKKEWKKPWKNSCKLRKFAVQIPKGYRMWTKNFIKQWRHENKISDATMEINECSETETPTPVPESYQKWLNKFLPKWHSVRGLLKKSANQQENEPMKFKDLVPKEFRKWVKCFLAIHYDTTEGPRRCKRFTNEEVDNAQNYQKWLEMFQKKWIQEKQMSDSSDDTDGFVNLTDSETETAKEPEKSIKQLRLSDDEGNEQKEKRNLYPNLEDQKKIDLDSDDADNLAMQPWQRKVPVPPEFQKMALQTLSAWDEKTVSGREENGADTNDKKDEGQEESIPPHIYRWMTKMMMKRQRKELKEQRKLAREEMKAARKEMKMARKLGKH